MINNVEARTIYNKDIYKISNKSIFLHIIKIIILLQLLTITKEETNCFESACEKCSDSNYGSCEKCKEAYVIINGSCACADPNCLKCPSSSRYKCEKCMPGYSLILGTCNKYEHCIYSNLTKCILCENGFKWDNDLHKCIDNGTFICNDPNCKSCFNNKEGSCEVCKDGYILEKGKCNKHCYIKYEIKSKELEYYINTEKTTKNIQYTKTVCYCDGVLADDLYCAGECGLAGCSSYKDGFCNNLCFQCQNYVLYDLINCGLSTQCSDINCQKCPFETTTKECTECKLGYFRKNGSCVKINVDYCINADYSGDPDICSICLHGYHLTSEGKCEEDEDIISEYPANKRIQQQIEIDNCKTLKEGFCEECNEGYKIDNYNGKCDYECNVLNCMKCNNTNKCEECNIGHNNYDNNCFSSIHAASNCQFLIGESCVQCLNGYEVTKDGRCNIKCNINDCNRCYVDERDNKLCYECDSGYTLIDNECKLCGDPNCDKCLSTAEKSCISCKGSEFSLYNGECGKTCTNTPNCLVCSSIISDYCILCKSQYTLKNGSCEKPKETNKIGIIIFISLIFLLILSSIYEYCHIKNARMNLELQLRNIELTELQRNRQNERNLFNLNGRSMAQSDRFNMINGNLINVLPQRPKLSNSEAVKLYSNEFNENCFTANNDNPEFCCICKNIPAEYVGDCGCKFCKEHKSTGKVKNDNDNIDDDNAQDDSIFICGNCKKVTKKVKHLKLTCGVCMCEKKQLSKFKCNCAMQVCKDCYIKCRMTSPVCPACRANLE